MYTRQDCNSRNFCSKFISEGEKNLNANVIKRQKFSAGSDDDHKWVAACGLKVGEKGGGES